MQDISTSLYKGMKGYKRLNGSGRRRRNRVEFGSSTSSSTKRQCLWKIKITPKIKSFIPLSPNKFFAWLRDAYVKMMLSFANSSVFSGPICDGGISGFGSRGPLKEYDDKIIIEIYNNLVMAQQGHVNVLPQRAASASGN